MMMVDTLVQIQAVHRANKEEEERKNKELEKRRFKKGYILGSHPVIARDIETYKLRSSKWFDQDEISIVCSVFESGFIVERRNTSQYDMLNTYAIALWDLGYEKSKVTKYLNIYTVIEESVHVLNIKQFWKAGTQIRICNNSDRYYPVNDEVTIRSQINRAEKMRFSSEEDFVYFCRYKNEEAARKRIDRNWSLSSILSRIRRLSIGGD